MFLKCILVRKVGFVKYKSGLLHGHKMKIGTEYFKHGIYSPFFFLQNAVCFIILTYLVPVLLIFYIQVC